MDELFMKTFTTIPVETSTYFGEKMQLLMIELGGKCYLERLNTKLPPLKNIRLRKKYQEKYDKSRKS